MKKCRQLLRGEPDYDVRLYLGYALLAHFSTDGIDDLRELLGQEKLSIEGRGLRRALITTCTIMEHDFPELEAWRDAERSDKEANQRRLEEIGNNPTAMIEYAYERLTGKKFTPPTPPMQPIRVPVPQRQSRVGRNDPCPCGSGKKFKQCCLKKQV